MLGTEESLALSPSMVSPGDTLYCTATHNMGWLVIVERDDNHHQHIADVASVTTSPSADITTTSTVVYG